MKTYPYNMSEFNKLVSMCVDAGWDFEVRDCWDGRQIILYSKTSNMYEKNRRVLNDVIIHNSSYGHEEGLLETWGKDDVEGYMTAKQVFSIWEENMAENKSYVGV